jgi:hypothetical protein
LKSVEKEDADNVGEVVVHQSAQEPSCFDLGNLFSDTDVTSQEEDNHLGHFDLSDRTDLDDVSCSLKQSYLDEQEGREFLDHALMQESSSLFTKSMNGEASEHAACICSSPFSRFLPRRVVVTVGNERTGVIEFGGSPKPRGRPNAPGRLASCMATGDLRYICVSASVVKKIALRYCWNLLGPTKASVGGVPCSTLDSHPTTNTTEISPDAITDTLKEVAPSNCNVYSLFGNFRSALSQVRAGDIVVFDAVLDRKKCIRKELLSVTNMYGFDDVIFIPVPKDGSSALFLDESAWRTIIVWLPSARCFYCPAYWSKYGLGGGGTICVLSRLVPMPSSWLGLHLMEEGSFTSKKTHLINRWFGMHICRLRTSIPDSLQASPTRFYGVHHSDWAKYTPILAPDQKGAERDFLYNERRREVTGNTVTRRTFVGPEPSDMERFLFWLEYRLLLLSPDNGTCTAGCRCYVTRRFHEHFPPTCLLLDPEDFGGAFDIHLTMKDHSGETYCQDNIVSVRTVHKDSDLLGKLNAVASTLFKRKGVSNCRSTSGDYGKMVPLGRVYRGGEHEAAIHKIREGDDSVTALRDSLHDVFKSVSDEARNLFAPVVHQIRQTESLHGIAPDYPLGGEHGICSSAAWSMDLGGASHMDTNDGSTGIVFWHEQEPGQANNWKFVMPNVTIERDGTTYYGLAIRLRHGVAAAFDGREIRHCTSVTHSGEGNATHGLFLGVANEAIYKRLP